MGVAEPGEDRPAAVATDPDAARRRRIEGVALILVSAASFGAMAVLARFAYASGAAPVAVLFWRFVVAAAAMAVLMAVTRRRWPRGRILLALVALGGLGYVGQSLAYFTALTMASASVVALLLYVYPALVTLLAAVLFRQRLDRVTVLALALAFAGSVLVIGPAGAARPLGIALGVASAVIYAGYILAGSRLTPRVGALPASSVVMLAAAAVYSVAALGTRPAMPGTAGGWAAVLAIALVSTVLAIVTFFAGMERLGPTDAATLSTVEPMVTVVLAAAVLGERIRPVQLAGGACVLAAVVLLTRHRRG